METEDYINQLVKKVHDSAVLEGKYLAISEMFNALHTGRITVSRTDIEYGIAKFLSEYMKLVEAKA